MADDNKPADPSEELEAPTFLQELRRHRLNKWTQRDDSVARYRTALDRVGGALRSNHCRSTRADEDHTISVCTVNVAGFDEQDTKIELLLQFMQDEDIDVLVCIDAQLDEKRGHWYGKIAKRRLGTGTRTNVNPCIRDYGAGKV